MINRLTIKNFKSIKNMDMTFDKFNLLCGENASGKTAIIHSILAVVQKYEDYLGLDGEIIKIGDYTEIHNRSNIDKVEIVISNRTKYKKIILNKNNKSSIIPKRRNLLKIYFENSMFYISSNRIGVVDTYAKENTKFGVNGLSFADFIFKNREKSMPDNYINKFAVRNVTVINNLLEHIRYWFKDITNEEIIVEQVPYTNQYILTFGTVNTRSINTGSGFSYLLPIIAVCIGSLIINNNMPTIIIENPEIYLHPGAQKKLTEFFLFMSDFVQIIVETHSDHILKTSIECKNTNDKIFVFNLNSNDETEKTEMNSTNFKTNPISYAEVQYRAFGILTPELHILLYGHLHRNAIANNLCHNTIKSFDSYLDNLQNTPKKTYTYNRCNYTTLPTYIRNCIDHPNYAMHQTYTPQELKESVDFLLSQL